MGGQWAPLKTSWLFDRTGTAIAEKFGAYGTTMWAGYLCACKSSSMRGRFIWYPGQEMTARQELVGPVLASSLPFSVDEFFRFTGRRHLTRTVQIGSARHVLCVSYSDWNADAFKEHDRDRKKRERNGTHEPPVAEDALDRLKEIAGRIGK